MGKEAVIIDPRLAEGRGILDASRERITPLWVIFRDKSTLRKDKVRLGPFWKNEIDEHIRAARGPISEAKKELGLRLTDEKVELRAWGMITDLVVFHGGTKKDGRILAARLIRLTRNMQEREGVSDDPSSMGLNGNNKHSCERAVFSRDSINNPVRPLRQNRAA